MESCQEVSVSPRQQPALRRGSDFAEPGETEELVAESERGEGSWKNNGVKLVLFSIFVTHSAINGNNSKSTCPQKI